MRYLFKVALAVVLTLLVWNVGLAEDYITDAVQALQQKPVYVAPSTEGTNKDTADKLKEKLNSNDNIMLVMLPIAAETELGADIFTIANRLSDKLGNQRIIGLAVGRKVIGYAPSLPAGVADDLMRRADSVSNDSFTALVTFVQNVHLWEKDHPQPKPSPIELPQTKEGGWPWFVWVLIVSIALLVVWRILAWLFKDRSSDHVNFDKAPHKVKELLEEIDQECFKVEDPQLQDTIRQIFRDITVYFEKYSSEREQDERGFANHLGSILEVIRKYVDVQNDSRYYDDPRGLMEQGKEAIESFADYVLKSCKRGSASRLLDYTVNTKILSAQRYS